MHHMHVRARLVLDVRGACRGILKWQGDNPAALAAAAPGREQGRDREGTVMKDEHHQAAPPLAPPLIYATALHVRLAPPMALGADGAAQRRIIPIIGGRAEGPKLRGRILDFGADWQLAREDGIAEIDTRYAIETEDGAIIEIRNPGIRAASPEVTARLAAGEPVDPSEYYFRCTPRLFCAAPAHAWVNRRLFVGAGERHAAEVIMRIWEIG